MSEYSAKTLRDKMKAKARSLAGEKDQKVDSSDWTPPAKLDANIKTGARPIMKPSSKGVGESNAARDTKAAIGKDLKRGGFKRGGVVKDAGVKDKKALGAIDPSPKRGAAGHYKKGGKIKKADGGILENLANALAGKGYIDGSTWISKEEPVTASDSSAPTPPRRPAKTEARSRSASRPVKRITDPQYPYGDKTISGAESPMASDRFMKSGGKAKKADGGIVEKLNRLVGYKSPAQKLEEGLKGVGKGRTSSYSSSDKEALSDISKGGSGSGLPSDETEFGKSQNYKKGGRTKRATGGLINALKGGKKVKGKSGAKTDIKITINAGKAPAQGADAGMMPPAPPAPPMPMMPPDAGAGAPAAMPGTPGMPSAFKKGGRVGKFVGGPMMGRMPPGAQVMPRGMPVGMGKPAMPGMGGMPAGPARGPTDPAALAMMQKGMQRAQSPMGAVMRKSGGRVSKVASSYKDMTAGAASGEGRLQKTDIAKKGGDAPARKEGGRISKVAKSYKDMTAGAGSGEGRMQKTDIAKAKAIRGK